MSRLLSLSLLISLALACQTPEQQPGVDAETGDASGDGDGDGDPGDGDAVPISVAVSVSVSVPIPVAVPIAVPVSIPRLAGLRPSPIAVPLAAEVALAGHVVEDRQIPQTGSLVDGRVILDAVPDLVIGRALAWREHEGLVDLLDHADQAVPAVRRTAAHVAGLGLAREPRRERERDHGGRAQQPREAPR